MTNSTIITVKFVVAVFPQMYLHMFAQRRKVIGQSDLSKTK